MAQRWQSCAINIRGVQETWPLCFSQGKLVPLPVLFPSPICYHFDFAASTARFLRHPCLWKELVPVPSSTWDG